MVPGPQSALDPAAMSRCVLAGEMHQTLRPDDGVGPMAHLAGVEDAERTLGLGIVRPALDENYLRLHLNLRKRRAGQADAIGGAFLRGEGGQLGLDLGAP